MNITTFSHPAVWALGWTLLHAIWQGFAIVLPVAVALHLLRRQSSRLRYGLSVGALFMQVLLSVGTFFYYYLPLLAISNVTASSMAPSHRILSFTYDPMPIARAIPWQIQVYHFLEGHLTEIVSCWLLGVGVFLIRLAGGWLYLQQLKQTAVQVSDMSLQQLAENLKDRFRLRGSIQILETARVNMPMVVGLFKPVVLLPVGLATGLSLREIEAVLAHELAHIQRADYAVNLLQSVVEVLFFFHPALWWLSARVREERELCCDDMAVEACGDGRILAQALAQVEEFAQTPMLAMALASERKQLLHRVRRMLGVPVKPVVSNASLAGLTLVTLLLLSVSVYAVQQKETKQDTKPKKSVRQKAVKPTKPDLIDDNKLEFTISDDNKVESIIWKGKRLPSDQVSKIQEAYVQLDNGLITLGDVTNSTNREILQTMLETRKEPEGLTGLAAIESPLEALAITGSVHTTDGLVAIAGTVQDSDTLPNEEFKRATLYNLSNATNRAERDRLTELHNRQMDSLNRINQNLENQLQALQLKMESQRFKVEEFERKAQLLEWKKDKAREQRSALIQKNQEYMYNNGKVKLAEAELEKRMTESEAKIKESEQQIEALNNELEKLQNEQKAVRQPYQDLEREMEQIQRQQEKIMEQNERNMEAVSRVMEGHIYVNGLEVTTRGRARASRTPRAARMHYSSGSALAPGVRATSPRTPRPVLAPTPAEAPAAVSVPDQPTLAPKPATTSKPSVNSRASKPATTPKPPKID